MATNMDSNDASDLFWPGYVDAISNLAINLLFVIAVMSIVVIATTLQISRMTPTKEMPELNQQISTGSGKSVPLQSNEMQMYRLQQAVADYQKKLDRAETELQQAKALLDSAENRAAQTVHATQNRSAQHTEPSRVQSLGQTLVVVVFSQDVVTLSSSEATELLGKLRRISALSSGRWEISVISPKGLSETVRLSYYRANAVRNALLENGVSSQMIELRIHESDQPGADNRKVLVRWLP